MASLREVLTHGRPMPSAPTFPLGEILDWLMILLASPILVIGTLVCSLLWPDDKTDDRAITRIVVVGSVIWLAGGSLVVFGMLWMLLILVLAGVK